jgi:uncharacterized GH25 family protein
MRIFQKIIVLLMAALPFHLCAVTNDLANFSGTVVDSQGKPVADAVVECFHFPNRVIVGMPEIESKQFKASDTNGAYEFSVPSGAVIVTAKKAGYGSGWRTWQAAPTGMVVPLVLAPTSTLAGMVVDENGQPVTNALVSVSAAADKREGEWAKQPNFLFGKAAKDLFSASTTADGHFRILNFPIGAQATLDTSAPGRALRMGGRNGLQFQVQAGQEDIKLIVDPTASIEGKVVLHDTGRPLANAQIQLAPVNPAGGISTSPASAQSAADGTFRIPEVPAGSYRINAAFTNQPVPSWVTESVPVTVATGETLANVKIEAFKGGVVELTVVGKNDQKFIPNAIVSVYAEGNPMSGSTGPEGMVWFRLPPGQFTVIATKHGMIPEQTQATVAEGETNRVKLELEPPAGGSDLRVVAKTVAAPQRQDRKKVPLLLQAIVLFGIAGVLFWIARKRKR